MLAVLLEVKSGRGAALVGQRGLSAEDVRLLLVDLGHLPAARGEARLDAVDDRLIDLHLQPERLRQRLARQVILGRPEAHEQRPRIGASGVFGLIHLFTFLSVLDNFANL